MSFALVTDSTCDLSPEVARQLDIHVVPLRVKVDQNSYLDWLEIDPDAVYGRQRAGAQILTSPPSQRRFEELYLRLLETHDFVVSVHLSAALSNTLQHARQAVVAHRLGARVLTIDSGLASVGLAEMVLTIREVLLNGGDADAAQVVAQQVRREIDCQFTVPTLEYLRKGGRLSRSQEVVGNLLGMRPLLRFDDGHLRVVRTVNQGQALQEMIRALEERFGDQPLSIAVVHAGRDPERLAQLRQAVEQSRLNKAYRRIQLVGSVIGAHGGPGFYGISALPTGVIRRAFSASSRSRHIGRH